MAETKNTPQPIGPEPGPSGPAGPARVQVSNAEGPVRDQSIRAASRGAGPLVRLRVKQQLRSRLAKAKRNKKPLSASEQVQLLGSVDNEAIDAAYDVAMNEADTDAVAQGPFLDWLISSGLIDKIVDILLKWLGL